jgi:hypothetical protein
VKIAGDRVQELILPKAFGTSEGFCLSIIRIHLTAGIYAAKTLEQHLCGRVNDPVNMELIFSAIRYATDTHSAFKRV